MTKIACPVPGAHDAGCICNGTRELRVSPVGSLCTTCGDADTQKNLGFIARAGGEVIGTACTTCGTVGDPAEYQRRADALSVPDAEPVQPPRPSAPAPEMSAATELPDDEEPELRVVREADGSLRIAPVAFSDGAPNDVYHVVLLATRDGAELAALIVDIAGALDRHAVGVAGDTLFELKQLGREIL